MRCDIQVSNAKSEKEQGIKPRVERVLERVLDLPGVTHSNALSLRLGI